MGISKEYSTYNKDQSPIDMTGKKQNKEKWNGKT